MGFQAESQRETDHNTAGEHRIVAAVVERRTAAEAGRQDKPEVPRQVQQRHREPLHRERRSHLQKAKKFKG